MVSKLCRLVCLLIAVPVVAVPVHAKAALVPRIALVIGNGAYQEFPALRNSVNDANLMARTLRGLGFEVVQRTDANRDAMVTAIRTFRDKIKSAGRQPVGLFYYAGHGVEWEGRNYLIPLNAGIKVEEDLEFRAVVAQSILHQLLNSDPALTLMILDACRDNPLPSRSRSGNGGLGFMGTDRQVRNAIIAFAAAPKQKAQDGPPGGNSPYTAALVTEMTRQPRSEIGMVFRRTTDAVSEQTNKEQRPWDQFHAWQCAFLLSGGWTKERPRSLSCCQRHTR